MNTCDYTLEAPAAAGRSVKKKSGGNLPGFVNMGSTLLLAVFLVITLVVFALLALSGAKNDEQFSRQLAQQKTCYYEACSRSEHILAQVDQEIRSAAQAKREPDLESLGAVWQDGQIFWEVPIDENRILTVGYDPESGTTTRWQVIPSEAWDGNQKLFNP